MALDAICLQAVLEELAPKVTGLRIEKIQQPARDQIVLVLRGSQRLLMSINPNQARIHLTSQLRDNPSQAPMFCMLLRKYLSSGRIVSLTQIPLERAVRIGIEATDEMGEQSIFEIVMEVMGRHSNLILLDKDGRIIDCLRRVDFEMSPDRQVLPGLFYQLPKKVEKLDPLNVDKENFLMRLPREEMKMDSWFLQEFTAISPLIARELVYRAYGMVDVLHGDERLWDVFSEWQEYVKGKNFAAYELVREGKPTDFSYYPILQYEDYYEETQLESFAQLLDSFYELREQAERVRQRGQDLLKLANSTRDRLRRKIAMQEKELLATADRETYRISGELLTANLYRLEKGPAKVVLENYYDNYQPMEIRLDPRLTPSENAAKYFKLYNKAKTAERMLTELLEKAYNELNYMESVIEEIQLAESEQDFLDIRAELTDGGYIRNKDKRAQTKRNSKPRCFISSSGLRILVGRSNQQNDKLTTKEARKWDLWLHTQKIHGSHVILCTDGTEADEQSIFEAATIAAYYSQGRESGKVAVDYTPAKYVHKPNGARPGMVIYTTYETMQVNPDGELVKSLVARG